MNWRGFLPKWAWRFFQMAGYLFGFVAVVFTVLTIPDDFKATVLGTTLSDGVPWFVLLIAAGVFLSIAQVGRMAIARAVTSDGPSLPKAESAVGSMMVTRDGVLDFADPDKAVIKPDENQQRIMELEAEVDRLSAWKDRTSDWEDKIDRLERVESTHAGCADHRDVLQARVTELEAEISEIRSAPTSADEDDEDTESYFLEDAEEQLLLAVEEGEVDGQRPTADYLAARINENMTRTKYYLDRLVKWGYLYDLLNTRLPTRYGVTEKGRAYLVENDLV